MVLAFKASILKELGEFQGYTLDVERYLTKILDPANNSFIPRSKAEQDTNYKQLIPYVVLRFRDQVFTYVRGRDAKERRLVAKRSIGFGGHIEWEDSTMFSSDRNLYLAAAKREVSEEVEVGSRYIEHVVALINDDSDEVGRVHFGIVHIWDLTEPIVTKREPQITQAKFVDLKRLKAAPHRLESWSQIALVILSDPKIPPYVPSPTTRG